MKQQPVIITLGIVQVIILSLFGMYFYRLTHSPSQEIEQKQVNIQFETPTKPDESSRTEEASICRRGGCNGEICQDDKEESLATACVVREEYACYNEAQCERQADGRCGFTQTDELKRCLEKAQSTQQEDKPMRNSNNSLPL